LSSAIKSLVEDVGNAFGITCLALGFQTSPTTRSGEKIRKTKEMSREKGKFFPQKVIWKCFLSLFFQLNRLEKTHLKGLLKNRPQAVASGVSA